jgi:putative DNA primase/helicase
MTSERTVDEQRVWKQRLDAELPPGARGHLRPVGTGERDETEAPFKYLGELDAARFFALQNADRIRHCAKAGGWLLWDGRHWKLDDDGSIYRLAAELVDVIAERAGVIPELEERKKVLTFAITLRKRRGLENVIELAKVLDGIAIGNPDRFDADQWLLNVENGTIDLRTGELRPHSRDDLITKLVPIEYRPEATCKRWERFLDEIFGGDVETVDFVQRATGYSLTGCTREHAFLVLYGTGANGKSSLLSLIGRLLGDYGLSASPETFVDRQAGAATNDLARLRGMRFVSAIETSEGRALAESFVKAVTGGDRIAARFLYTEYFDFEPAFKLWLGTNHKPIIKGGDEGIWRRVRLVPFLEHFEGERCDPDLRDKLEAELPGILAWAVRGCLEWQKRGLKPPESVSIATAAYRAEMDVFSGFIDEQCVIDPAASVPAGELYQAYKIWADCGGEKPLSQRWFADRLSERGFTRKPTNRKRLWIGLQLAKGDA